MTLSIPHHHVAKPTEAQKDAGNYRKAHVRIHSLDVTIENPKGSTRAGKDADGKAWRVSMPAHYGYIRQTSGADGDHVDCYIGPNPKSDRVYIVNQVDAKTKTFDEHKCMLGYSSRSSALKDYVKAFSDGKGRDRMGGCVEMSIDQFKAWVKSHNTKAPARYDTGGVVYPYDGTSVLGDMKQYQSPSRADFLRSEKDTRPYEETFQRHSLLPIGVSGYNSSYEPVPQSDPGASMFGPELNRYNRYLYEPGFVRDVRKAFEWFGDKDAPVTGYNPDYGREMPSPEAIGHVNALVGATMVGGGAATKPEGAAGSFAGRTGARNLEAKGSYDVSNRLANREEGLPLFANASKEGGVAGIAANAKALRPEPEGLMSQGRSNGVSSVLAETPEANVYAKARQAADDAWERDIQKNKHTYFDDWRENPADPIVVDNLGRQIGGGQEISERLDAILHGGLDQHFGEFGKATSAALEAAAKAAGRELAMSGRGFGGSFYGTLKTPAGNTYKVRSSNHAKTSSMHDKPDFNVAPGVMTPDEFIRLLPTIYSSASTPTGAFASQSVPQSDRDAVKRILDRLGLQ